MSPLKIKYVLMPTWYYLSPLLLLSLLTTYFLLQVALKSWDVGVHAGFNPSRTAVPLWGQLT